ncbi:MAG: AAA family ATPase [Xanthomonadales bacterium]|nr:AAA family ATPase [Xanthomonadales bacterium]
MYLRYFGLDEAPFSITPDPAFVYLSQRHRDALAHLLYGIGQDGSGGFVQLTGEVGTGKTTLCRCLLEQVPENTRIALLLNPLVTPRELLAAVSEELGIDIRGSIDSTRLLVDGLNRYLLEAHQRGERVVVVIDEAQNLSPEALEQIRLLTNLETSKEKLLQVVLLGQPELRELLQRRSLRQLAQRVTARFHLSPLGPKDTHLYIRHRMQVAGAQRNLFRRSAMNALYQRSQGIPRLINIIADRALTAAFVKERADVTAAMVHAAANEVQLGEKQVRRMRWPWLVAAAGVLVIAIVLLVNKNGWLGPTSVAGMPMGASTEFAAENLPVPAEPVLYEQAQLEPQALAIPELDADWLADHQPLVWQGLAEAWRHPGAAFSIQASCNGDTSRGYACLQDQGSWAKIKRLDLPVILLLRQQDPSYLLLHGLDDGRLLVGSGDQLKTVSKQSVEALWFGKYLVAWPQAPDWPVAVSRGDDGPAVNTIMEMASRVAMPYHGERVFDQAFENWLKGFQARNGLEADGIVGRNTLLYLMTASIEDPKLLAHWE